MLPAKYQSDGFALYIWELEEILYMYVCLCLRIWNQAVWKYIQVVLWTLMATLCCLAPLEICRVHWWNLTRSWKLGIILPAVISWGQVTQLNKLLPWTSKLSYCCGPVPVLSVITFGESLPWKQVSLEAHLLIGIRLKCCSVFFNGICHCKSCILQKESHFSQTHSVTIQLLSKLYGEYKLKRNETKI